MRFVKTECTDLILAMRIRLYSNLTAPIDAMWEQLYIASSQHHLIQEEGSTRGYCCVTSENCLVQLYLEESYCYNMKHTVQELLDLEIITCARLSSNEPIAFNACLSLAKSITPNTLCYQHTNLPIDINAECNIAIATAADISDIKLFLKEQVGMDDTFGYTENLVSRKEIFVIKDAGQLIATSERRISDTQPQFSDLGIIVHKSFRGKGIASDIMQMQVNRVLEEGRSPICSTTVDNVASQKAISRAGFYCSNIIFDIALADVKVN